MGTDDELGARLAEYADVLTHANIAQFLATESWSIQQERGWEQVWVKGGVEHRGSPVYVHIPQRQGLDDYSRRLYQAVEAISQVYGANMAAIAERVSAVFADLFFVRVDQPSRDGTIPFRQANELLESIDDMVRSAALTAHNPRGTGKGRMPGYVNDFLTDDVRMGHTKRGSFIITVAARLDSGDAQPTHSAPNAEGAADSADRADKDEQGAIASYPRQVMTTLARSLEVTQQYAASQGGAMTLQDAVANGMRLPMVKALRSAGDSEGVRSLDLSFVWSQQESGTPDVPSKITLTREVIQLLEPVEVRLAKREGEPSQQTIVGSVVELKRGDDSEAADDSEGEVVIRAEVDGRLIKVTVPLQGEDYDWAIQAHRRRLPFTVSGLLEKVKRSWRLTGQVQADTEFIRYVTEKPEQG